MTPDSSERARLAAKGEAVADDRPWYRRWPADWPDLVLALDASRRVRWASRAAISTLWSDPEAAMGSDLASLCARLDDVETLERAVRQHLEERSRAVSAETQMVLPAGDRWIEWTLRAPGDGSPDVIAIGCDVTDRVAQVRAREALVRELRHRARNHLQTISSLLSLALDSAGDLTALRQKTRSTLARIQPLAMAYELASPSEQPDRVEVSSYLESVARAALLEAGSAIQLSSRLSPSIVRADDVAPLGLIVHELISNAAAHAFPGERKGVIALALRGRGPRRQLEVADDGVGLPADLDVCPPAGMGLQIAFQMARKVRSALRYVRAGRGGSRFLMDIEVLTYQPEDSGIEAPPRRGRPVTDRGADGAGGADGADAGAAAATGIHQPPLLSESERRHAKALEEKDTLLREMHHRVKNDLQVISSLLYLHSKRAHAPEDLALLDDLRRRITAMTLVHEQLHRSGPGSIELASYVRALLAELQAALRPGPRVQIEVSVDGIVLPIELAAPFGMILHELTANALEHAFPNGRAGRLSVAIRRLPTEVEFCVDDTGVGFPNGFDARAVSSFGWELVRRLAVQLEASTRAWSDEGSHVRVRFTLPRRADAEPLAREPSSL